VAKRGGRAGKIVLFHTSLASSKLLLAVYGVFELLLYGSVIHSTCFPSRGSIAKFYEQMKPKVAFSSSPIKFCRLIANPTQSTEQQQRKTPHRWTARINCPKLTGLISIILLISPLQQALLLSFSFIPIIRRHANELQSMKMTLTNS
jgi:hypothetical protein